MTAQANTTSLREHDLQEGMVSATMYMLAVIILIVALCTTSIKLNKLFHASHGSVYFVLTILSIVEIVGIVWFAYKMIVAFNSCRRSASKLRKTLEFPRLGILINLNHHESPDGDGKPTPGPTAAAYILAGCSLSALIWTFIEWLHDKNIFGLSPIVLGLGFLCVFAAAAFVAVVSETEYPNNQLIVRSSTIGP